jgi:hypothetical protein
MLRQFLEKGEDGAEEAGRYRHWLLAVLVTSFLLL